MSTFTIRVSSSATTPDASGFGQQPDLNFPSYFDLVVSNSTDPALPNGVYDAYCLNPVTPIVVTRLYESESYSGAGTQGYQAVGFDSMTQRQVDQINWLLAQNLTADSKYAGRFNYGELQSAIWKILGFSAAQIASTPAEFLTDNFRHTVNQADVDFLVSAAGTAVDGGQAALPRDTFFSALIDPAGNVQPLVVQLQTAKLGNYVWLDTNANGLQDAGEAGVDNVVVELYDGQGRLLSTTRTGDDASTAEVEHGYYQFAGLKAGNYQVKFIAPTASAFTARDAQANGADTTDSDADTTTGLSQIVALAAGESNQTIDAGLVKSKASLGDFVWEDRNANGVQDAGEAGMAGVTVQLKDSTGTVVQTATTDAAGKYGFSVEAGTYSVQVVAPSGYTVSSKDQGGDDAADSDIAANGASGPYTLAAGEHNPTIDAGLYRKASLGDRVWFDTNRNGVQDSGEAGATNVTVQLLDAGGAVLATQQTNASGNYLFSDLAPGVYAVRFAAPSGYALTQADAGNDAADSDANATTGTTGTYVLSSGEQNLSVDAGLVSLVQPKASLGDFIWEDRNANGVQDAGEAGIAGVTVQLKNSTGTVVQTTATDAAGKYGFSVEAGTYSVQVVAPSGYAVSSKDQGGNDAADSDIAANGASGPYTLAAGEHNPTIDAGLYRKASLGDRVWFDTNRNGVQDSGETGASNVTVQLLDAGGGVLATQQTNASGNYLFSDLTPGAYQVKFAAPSGYKFSPADSGSDDARDSDVDATSGRTGPYTLTSGESNLTADAGLVLCQVDLGDRVWEDRNVNGVQDAGETGIANVKVSLTGAGADGRFGTADDTRASTTTDANGNYLFTNVLHGSYKVDLVLPTGYTMTQANAGSDDAKDSDFAARTATTNLVVNGSFETNPGPGAYSSISGWTANGDKVEVGGPGTYGVSKATGNYIVELDGNNQGGKASGIYQDVQTEAGRTYNLSVDVAQRAGTAAASNTVEVFWGGNKVATIQPTSTALTTHSFSVTGTGGSTRLEFREPASADDGVGSIIDNVQLTAPAAAIADVVVDNCEDNLTIDAGLYRKASLGDRVWLDTNENGVQDSGEKGLADVTVQLLDAGGAVLATQKTDATGNYLFADLMPDTYSVKFVAPTNYVFTKTDTGGSDEADSDASTTTGRTGSYTLTPGQENRTVDAGLIFQDPKTGRIGDRIFVDNNHNGIQDSGDYSVGGRVPVTLWKLVDGQAQVAATTTTDGNGYYLFTGLSAGQYQVGVQVNGFVETWWFWANKDVGSNDSIDSDGIHSGARISSTGAATKTDWFQLAAGQTDLTRDFGVTPIAIDLDGNGIQTIARTESAGRFDLFGNGQAVHSGWLSGGDGFLAVDQDGNGRIDDISELFGGTQKGSGFAKLAAFDSNGDGAVNSADADFAKLLVWRDLDGNHATDEGELMSLLQAGIASLAVAYTEVPELDAQGNLHLERSSALRTDGRAVAMTDVYFNVAAEDVDASGVAVQTIAQLLGSAGVQPDFL